MKKNTVLHVATRLLLFAVLFVPVACNSILELDDFQKVRYIKPDASPDAGSDAGVGEIADIDAGTDEDTDTVSNSNLITDRFDAGLMDSGLHL